MQLLLHQSYQFRSILLTFDCVLLIQILNLELILHIAYFLDLKVPFEGCAKSSTLPLLSPFFVVLR
jgi:hypothetical protein